MTYVYSTASLCFFCPQPTQGNSNGLLNYRLSSWNYIYARLLRGLKCMMRVKGLNSLSVFFVLGDDLSALVGCWLDCVSDFCVSVESRMERAALIKN